MKYSLKKDCLRLLRDVFGMAAYRPGQKTAVRTLLSGRDLMCILPTGAGKSLCWQLPAVVYGGLTVVVSPLIALMRDQVAHLKKLGIPALSLDSLQTPQERRQAMEAIRCRAVQIVLVSPERLLQPAFRSLCKEVQPWLLVVDEAHCILRWGEDFRPAYGEIASFLKELPRKPVLCALTATADQAMQKEISSNLGMHRPRHVMLPCIRENLRYEVHTTLDAAGLILQMCMAQPCKTVIFCGTRAGTEAMSALLRRNHVQAEYYHAGMLRDDRLAVQERFVQGKTSILCATSAFGMGIDIPDIRRVIHAYLPDDLIDYAQQSGRAGRDGKEAQCILLLEPNALIRKGKLRGDVQARLQGHPIRRRLYLRRTWHKLEQMLRVMLASPCIPAEMAARLGKRTASCGICSACRNGKRIKRIPHLYGMHEWQMRLWFLRWQRDEMARKYGCKPSQIMPDAALRCGAKRYVFPSDIKAPPEMERLLAHLQGERVSA